MMGMKWVWALVFLILAVLPFVAAEDQADWFAIPIRYSWDLSMGGSCTNSTQCLIHLLGNDTYDGDIQRYFKQLDTPGLGPRCANNSQYILDYSCDAGNWTTRTKYLALYLLKYAEANSAGAFTLYCDTYERVLNQFSYYVKNVLVSDYFQNACVIQGKTVPCINKICVLRTPQVVAIGTTINGPINDPARSFLIALNESPSLCDGHDAEHGTDFTKCEAEKPVWYNPSLQAVVWLSAGSLAPPTADTRTKITTPMSSMSSYVMNVLHNEAKSGMNFIYFPRTRLFNHIYVAQNGPRGIFGFLEAGLRPEYTLLPDNESEPIPLDYIGVRYTGIELYETSNLTCLNLIKKYDTNAFCENQTATGFNVIARHRCEPGYEDKCKGASPIVGVWPALAGKLRP
jgi:hypothetical protein